MNFNFPHIQTSIIFCICLANLDVFGVFFERSCCAYSLSRVWLFATPWAVAHQAPHIQLKNVVY